MLHTLTPLHANVSPTSTQVPVYYIDPETDIFTAGLLFNVLEDALQTARAKAGRA